VRPLFLPLIGWLLQLVGCADPIAPIETTAGKLTQAQVDAIVQQCGGQPGMAIVREGKLIIQPSKNLSITACVLKALQATGQTTLPAVANERHDPPGHQTR
jgi:hypothetical protein